MMKMMTVMTMMGVMMMMVMMMMTVMTMMVGITKANDDDAEAHLCSFCTHFRHNCSQHLLSIGGLRAPLSQNLESRPCSSRGGKPLARHKTGRRPADHQPPGDMRLCLCL